MKSMLNAVNKSHVQESFNQELAYFLSDLLYFFDQTITMDLINTYLTELDSNDVKITLRRKFEFLKIICDHEYYPSLTIPIPGTVLSVRTVTRKFW